MKRRGFLQSLAAITAASAFHIFGKTDPVAAVQASNVLNRSTVNPAYLAAEYEEVLIWHPRVMGKAGGAIRPTGRRYRFKDGGYVEIPRSTDKPLLISKKNLDKNRSPLHHRTRLKPHRGR